MSSRSARFTASEVRKTFATSGSRSTTFVPLAQRAAYLPRTPPAKSTSSGISGSLGWFFFIGCSLAPPLDFAGDQCRTVIDQFQLKLTEEIATKDAWGPRPVSL